MYSVKLLNIPPEQAPEFRPVRPIQELMYTHIQA